MNEIFTTTKDLFTKKIFYIDPCHDSELFLSDKIICEAIEKFAKEQNEPLKILSKSAPIQFEIYNKKYTDSSDGLFSQIGGLSLNPIIACREV